MSPYPPREEWVETRGILTNILEYQRFWEKSEFVRNAIAKKDKASVETLELGWWLDSGMGQLHVRNA